MRSDRVIAWGAGRQWAILPDALESMVEFATRDKLGVDELTDAIRDAKNTIERQQVQLALDKGQILSGTENVIVQNGIALIPMIGPIFRYADSFSSMSGALTLDQIKDDYNAALNDQAVKSIVFVIDSPGGDAAGIGDFAHHISTSKNKPIKAFAAYQCCSAAYWIAAAADDITASSTATIGSIGAIMQVANPDNVKPNEPLKFVSSKSKKKLPDLKTDEGKQVVQDRVNALGSVFAEEVSQLRGMKLEEIENMDGAAFVGRQALDNGLVDKISTLEQLLASMTPKIGGNMAKNGLFAQMAELFSQAAETEETPVVAATPQIVTNHDLTDADRKELADLRAANAKLHTANLQLKATEWAKDVILSGKAMPAEMTDLIETYLDAARDDEKHGLIALADGVTISRVERVIARNSRRVGHNLTNTITGTDQIVTLPNNIKTENPDVEKPLSENPERRIKLLSMTADGRKVLAQEGIKID